MFGGQELSRLGSMQNSGGASIASFIADQRLASTNFHRYLLGKQSPSLTFQYVCVFYKWAAAVTSTEVVSRLAAVTLIFSFGNSTASERHGSPRPFIISMITTD